MPTYLIRENKKGAPDGRAHLWREGDNLCRTWSTGGISRKDRYKFYDHLPEGIEACANCERMINKTPRHLLPADSRGDENMSRMAAWQSEYLKKLRECSNEELFDVSGKGEYSPWDDLFPDDWDGCYTSRGGWMAGEMENEIRRRLGVPAQENAYHQHRIDSI